jgi:hypothetical protein
MNIFIEVQVNALLVLTFLLGFQVSTLATTREPAISI